MPLSVTDARSNPNDQIAHAANVLRRSERLRKMFDAVCRGGARPKSVAQIMRATGYSHVAVLQLGGTLSDKLLIHKSKQDGTTFYEKDRFYSSYRTKILRLATNPGELRSLPTKYAPRVSSRESTIKLVGARIQISEVTCDDFAQFSKIKKIK